MIWNFEVEVGSIIGRPWAYVSAVLRVLYREGPGSVVEMALVGGAWSRTHLTDLIGAPAAAGNPMGYVDPGGLPRVVYRDVSGGISELAIYGGGWGHFEMTDVPGAPSSGGAPMGIVDGGTAHVLYGGPGGSVCELFISANGSEYREVAPALL